MSVSQILLTTRIFMLRTNASGITCASCRARPVPRTDGMTPFSPSRYLCIDCSDKEVDHSIDFCAACFAEHRSAMQRNIIHKPASHNVLQLRRTRLRVYRHALLSEGVSAARRASALVDSQAIVPSEGEEKIVRCVECNDQIKERPFWYCIDCRGKWLSLPYFVRAELIQFMVYTYQRLRVCVLQMQQTYREGEALARTVARKHRL